MSTINELHNDNIWMKAYLEQFLTIADKPWSNAYKYLEINQLAKYVKSFLEVK